ncbi:MAG: PD-(D/E)XK nuclease family transposase [Lachnospiraceae bacterium]|nr:PD-(D/E)XK nuclease family transposase [Lachnospiraceae bacterium]
MRNVKTGRLYSDKFNLRVIDLTQIANATEEDKRSQIYHWARLFKATTWEEIRMIAANNEYLSEASRALFVMNADEIAREQSLAREDYRRWQNTIERMRDEDAKIMEEQRRLLEEKDAEIARLKALLAEKETE